MNVDMAPTMLELAGLRPTAEMQGRSVVPLFKGGVKDWRTSFLAEYFMEPNFARVPSWQAVRNESWKYVHYTELPGMDELYNITADPGEMKNLIQDAPTILPGMKKDLEKFNEAIR